MLRIRSLEMADLATADEVLRAAFSAASSFAPRLRRYLALQPDGWWLAESAGVPAGMVGAIDYGQFAYVGMMGVRPDRQGQGVGRRLMETLLAWLDQRGVTCARLDATDQGRLLYQRIGFVDAGVSHELWAPAEQRVAAAGEAGVELATDQAEIVALDRELFGADRERLWRWLFVEDPAPVLVARKDGRAIGYVCVQADTLGPWAARTPEAASALLRAATPLIRGPRTRVMVPGENPAGRGVLEAQGWTEQKVVPHMSRGPCRDFPAWTSIYGKGSYCLG